MPKPALVSVFLLAVSVLAAAQANTNQHVFSFKMTAPVITAALQVECRKTSLRTLRNTSATARVVRQLAGKATCCKLAGVQRQPPRHRQALRLQVHRVAAQLTGALIRAIPRNLIDSSAAVFRKHVRRARHVRFLVIQRRGITMLTRTPTQRERLNA